MPSRPDRWGRQARVDLPGLPGKGCRGLRVREGQEDFPVLRVPLARASVSPASPPSKTPSNGPSSTPSTSEEL
jgi:hypothetical protein